MGMVWQMHLPFGRMKNVGGRGAKSRSQHPMLSGLGNTYNDSSRWLWRPLPSSANAELCRTSPRPPRAVY